MTEVLAQGRRFARIRTGLTPTAPAVAVVAAIPSVPVLAL